MNTFVNKPRLKKIMVIGGDGLDIPALLADLEFLGYQVAAVARDMNSAIQALAGERPDLTLVSIEGVVEDQSPQADLHNGTDIAIRLREKFDLPVVFLVSGGTLEGLEHTRQAKPFGYIFLPYQRTQLYMTIETACRHAEFENTQKLAARNQAEAELQISNQKLVEEIAEHQRTEHILRQSEDRYLSFLQNFDGIAFRLRQTSEGGYEPVFYHGAVESISGYREEELLRDDPRWEQILHPDDQLVMSDGLYRFSEPADAPGAQVAGSPSPAGDIPYPVIDREYRILRRDGQMRWVHEVAQVFEGDNGEGVYLQGAIYDITSTKQREFEIRAVASVSSKLSMAISRQEIPRTLLQQVNQLLHARGAALMLFDPDSGKAVCEMGTGAWEKYAGRQLADGDITYRVISEQRFYLNNDALNIAQVSGLETYPQLRGIACVPLIAQKQIIGALWVAKNNPITGEELRAFAAIGDMAASVLQQATLFEKLQQAYDSTLEGWALALELRDHETQGHSIRVAEATVRLAQSLGIMGQDLIDVRRGALLHDIGKIAVPDHILLKPGPLDEREQEVMRLHPVYAYDMLSPIKFLHKALEIPYNHHERWDGSGYPRGIAGKQIPLAARIFAIIDVWDSLLSDRPYRPAWPLTRVYDYLHLQEDQQFDPQVVKAFFDTFG